MTPSHCSDAPRWRRVATAVVFTCALLHAASGKAADLVLTGARVYTVNPAQPWASELAVEDGRIVYVGEDASAFVDPGTRVVNLDGRMILPGFQDAHAHPASGGVKYTEFLQASSEASARLGVPVFASAKGKGSSDEGRGRPRQRWAQETASRGGFRPPPRDRT